MIRELEKSRGDLKDEMVRSEELKKELWACIDARKRTEGDLRTLEGEIDKFKDVS